jgi:hypothetical protein
VDSAKNCELWGLALRPWDRIFYADVMVANPMIAHVLYPQTKSRLSWAFLPCLVPKIARCIVLIIPLAVIAGCAAREGVEVASTWRSVPAESAFALPPPGGPSIVNVMERRYTNATQQDIALATTSHARGQNVLRVQFFGPINSAIAGSSSLSDTSLPATNISSEMRKALPGIPLRQSPYYVQNRYGPFGYAVGRAGASDLCIYAWQRIRPGGRQTTLISNKGTIQLRLRLCETGATEERLLSFMYGFSITGFIKDRGWNPYGSPASPSESLGRPGTPIYPTVQAAPEAVQGATAAAPQPPARPRRARAKSQAAISAPPPIPAPIGPTVPPPPGISPAAAGMIVPSPPCSPQTGGQNDGCN